MQKFIVIGMPRTGSSLLQTTLAQHPQIKMYGELFHMAKTEREGSHAINNGKTKIFFNAESDDAIDFLRKHVWNEENNKYGAVGFKLFGERVECTGTQKLFLRLKEAFPELKFIHIERPNLLECWVSREAAKKTGKWVDYSSKTGLEKSSKDTNNLQIIANPLEMKHFFQRYEEFNNFFRSSFFARPNYFHVDYDQLSTDFEQTSQAIFSFLGLKSIKVTQKIRKQRELSAVEQIQNIEEVRQYFSQSKYASFFTGTSSLSLVPSSLFELHEEYNQLIQEANELAKDNDDLSVILKKIPIDIYAHMQVLRDKLPEPLQSRIPQIPAKDEQIMWAGDSGLPLMLRTSDYLKVIMNKFYRSQAEDQKLAKSDFKSLNDIYFLDYGCGWGRVSRFMAAFVHNDHIYGVDPLKKSLDICERDKVPGKFFQINPRPKNDDMDFFAGIKFDIINCFSVFSHLSEEAHRDVLAAIRKLTTEKGIVFISIRVGSYWKHLKDEAAQKKYGEHVSKGFAFLPAMNDGKPNPNYGDTTISFDYIQNNWTDWNLESIEFSHYQPNQAILCLRPR